MHEQRAETLFRCFGDPARRQVLRLLGETPLTVGEIVDVLDMPQSTVSRHLKSLREADLVVDRREGTRVYTRLADPSGNGEVALVENLVSWLRERPLAERVRARLERVLSEREGLGNAFDRLAHQWDEMRREYFGTQFHLEALAALLPREWHVLDVGTGTGYLLPVLSRQFRRVTAIDPSPAMLGLARQRAADERLHNVTFLPGRLEELPLADGGADAAIAMLVLHHAQNTGGALAELQRVLGPEGRLLIVELAPHDQEDLQRAMGDPVAGIDPEELERCVETAGFRVTASRVLPAPLDGPTAPRKPAPDVYVIVGEKNPPRSAAKA